MKSDKQQKREGKETGKEHSISKWDLATTGRNQSTNNPRSQIKVPVSHVAMRLYVLPPFLQPTRTIPKRPKHKTQQRRHFKGLPEPPLQLQEQTSVPVQRQVLPFDCGIPSDVS
jgi:hypothetical protein